jgi:hypothetical protein
MRPDYLNNKDGVTMESRITTRQGCKPGKEIPRLHQVVPSNQLHKAARCLGVNRKPLQEATSEFRNRGRVFLDIIVSGCLRGVRHEVACSVSAIVALSHTNDKDAPYFGHPCLKLDSLLDHFGKNPFQVATGVVTFSRLIQDHWLPAGRWRRVN